MPLNPGDLLFVGWDSDNNDISFVATTDIAAGEVIYFTDDEWNGTNFLGSEQLIEWTVPAGGLDAGTVVNIDMDTTARDISFDSGGDIDYIRGGYDIAGRNEMFWAFQGTRSGNAVTPTDFVAVIGNEADGGDQQTPNLSGTGLTTSNGAVIIDGDEDYMEWTGDADLSDPVNRDDLIDSILDLDNWDTADGGGNSNPNGTGFNIDIGAVVCFAAQTKILTERGLKAIKTLNPGDMVATAHGTFATIRWIGSRHIGHEILARNEMLRPVRICAGALGQGLPTRDLLVSRQHRMMISSRIAKRMFGQSDVLVPAVKLTALPGIFIDTDVIEITYMHLLCDNHEVLFAEGAPAESLYLGAEALTALTPAARMEIRTIFPDIWRKAAHSAQANLMIPKARQRRLISRHLKNDKPLIDAHVRQF